MKKAIGRLLITSLVCGPLAGCATGYEQPQGPNILQAIGDRYAGRPLTELMGRYGAPARQMQVGAETIYSWEVADTLYFGSQPPLYVRCQLDAYVPETGIVRTVSINGKEGACIRFMP